MFSVSSEPIDCAALNSSMQDDAAGGFVSFEGWVRNNNEGHSVTALEYEVFHALAQTEGQKILDEAISKFDLIDARTVHREGSLTIGDCAIWIGVSARHRGEAFAGCRYIIDEMKHRLPVWKKEHYEGLNPQWVNCQHHHHHTPPLNIKGEDFYSRQMLLPEIGNAGQQKLSAARVLIIGVGGLGSTASIALAAAGIGTLGLVDYDILSVSNLHRQTLYSAADIGKPKAHLAATRLKSLNPFINVEVYTDKASADNIEELFTRFDIILDCTDNFTAKYLLNDAAILYKKPVIQASIYRFEGQILTIDANDDKGCLRCLFPEPPAPGMVGDCATVGVLGTVPMLFGTLQANEAIKRVLGLEASQDLLMLDLLSLQSHKLKRERRLDCAICGEHAALNQVEPNIDLILQPNVTEDDLRRQFIFVDVRESWEISEIPLNNAVYLPTSDFNVHKLDIPQDKELLVICAHGIRSQEAAKYLRQAGWTKSYSLQGGMEMLRRRDHAA